MKTQELIDMYNSGQSLAFCSKHFGLSKYLIKKELQNNGVRIRSAQEQTAITNQLRRKGALDEEYFSSIDTYNKAWLLGFLMADGTVKRDSNEIKIGLSAVDKEILEKIKEEIKTTRQIGEYLTNNGFKVVELCWSSKKHKEDLASYGIVNNKTYLPLHLPNFDFKKQLAFILGYFDGDGSFSVSKQGYCRMRFCAHRNELLTEIANFFQMHYQAKYSLSQDKRGLWELSISTTYAIPIFKDMYQLNSIRLDRKYQKFLEYINHETVAS